MEVYKVIGIMSGTSLDGLDLAFCTFRHDQKKWFYSIDAAQTIGYSTAWKESLRNVESASALDLAKIHSDYGHYIGEAVKDFISTIPVRPDFISSHGHTVFHQPGKKLTLQIGHGAAIAAIAGIPAICDFRSTDVALGGQGAPLVPIGDALLFGEYDYCLNIGGIANISYQANTQRLAFDICPANMVLNYLVSGLGMDYDKDGMLAAKGTVNKSLLKAFSSLPFYSVAPPKSLGKEWIFEQFIPLLEHSNLTIEDKLATVCEHIAREIYRALPENKNTQSLLITGGGAFNLHLLERIHKNGSLQVVVPDKETINFKEALIFAFLGVLRMRNEPNCLQSVTGALRDNVGGAIYL